MKKLIILSIFLLFTQLSFARDDTYYTGLYEKASQAIQKGNEQDADFYLARYIGISFLDKETKKDISDLYSLFKSYKVSKPTAFISGKYSDDFIEWFILSSNAQWGQDDDDDLDPNTHSCGLASGESKDYIATVIGSPYLEGWSILKDKGSKTAILTLIDSIQKPYIVVIRHVNSVPKKVFEKMYLDTGTNHIQRIWPLEFHDLDGDGQDELWVRYNKAWADGFSQELAIYRIKDNSLELIKKFEGLAEGIARRMDGNKIQVGTGFTDNSAVGHIGYDQHHLETWEYKKGKFVKTSEKNVPHILWSDEWKKYYFDKK